MAARSVRLGPVRLGPVRLGPVGLWRRLATVRARTTVAATLIVSLAIGIAVAGLLFVLVRTLVNQIDEVAEVRARDVAALVRQGTLPHNVRQGSLPDEAGAVGDDTSVVQVVDEGGRVLGGSPARIADFRPAGPEPEFRTVGRSRVVALRAEANGSPVTIYVATSLEPINDTLAVVGTALGLGGPVLVALLALTTWVLVGRALRPVDAIGAEADEISDRSLHRRLPVPAAHDEISRLAATMNRMLDRLEDAAMRHRRFVANASHELRTPLASARTDLEVALAHPERSDWRETAAALLTENRRMESLVRDLLFLARAESGTPLRPAVPLDLDDVVLAEATRLRTENGVRIDTSRVSAAAVLGRRDDLARAVGNLLDNARRHAASCIVIELGSDDHGVTLVVADDGAGIAAQDRERVFERFSRLDDARDRDSGGAGLGLSIVREIIDAHGGAVRVDDAPRGARFVVRLPAA
jgi:signal transduction histidine kinase